MVSVLDPFKEDEDTLYDFTEEFSEFDAYLDSQKNNAEPVSDPEPEPEPDPEPEPEPDPDISLGNNYADFDAYLASQKKTASEVDLSSIPTSRKISYGMEQETTLGYNLYKYASSAIDAFLNDGDTEVNLLQAELLRQKEIEEKFPEFAGLHKSQEDMAISGGRISQNIFDPTYALFPWARVATLGAKAAGTVGSVAAVSTLTGGVVGAESAARQKVIEGDVDLRQVGIEAALGFTGGAVLGFAGTAVASRLAKGRAKRTKEAEELIEDLKDSEKTAPTVPEVKVTPTDTSGSPIAAFAAKSAEEAAEKVTPPKVRQDAGYVEGAAGSPMATFAARATYQNLSSTEAGSLGTAFNTVVGDLGESTINKLGLDARELSAAISIHTKVQNRIRGYKKELKTLKGAEKKKVKAILAKAVEAEKLLKQDMVKRLSANIEDVSSVNMQVIEKLAETGGLTDNIYRTVVGQVTRPIFGAIGGGVIGNMFDEDGTHENLLYGFMIGAGLGVWQRRIQRSKKLSSIEKETGLQIINDSALEGVAHQTNSLKSFTATTVASKMDSLGGIAKVVGNRLFSRFGSAADSVEARSIRAQSEYLKSLYTIEGMEISPSQGYFAGVGDAAKKLFLSDASLISEEQNNIATIVGELMNGFIDPASLKAGYKGLAGDLKNVTADQIEKAKQALPEFQNIQNGMKNSVDEVGIPFKELEDYGLTQIFNTVKIQDNYNSFLRDLTEAVEMQAANGGKRLEAVDFANKVSGKTPFTYRETDAVFSIGADKKRTFRGIADYFENQRQLTDFEARKFLASKGWIDLNAQEALATYGTNTIKVVEFARTFGPTGELIEELLDGIAGSFKQKRVQRGLSESQLTNLNNLEEKYITTVTNGIEAYWGVYGKQQGSFAEHLVRTLQAAGNMSYLTTVTIANLPDLLQPFINSGFGAAAKQLAKNTWKGDERFSTLGTFKYDNSFERELTQLFSSQSSGRYGRNLANVQELWFATIGLKKITSAARDFAYDVGVSRAYKLAKKSKGDRTNLKRSELKELEDFGLNAADGSDLKEILKHNNAVDAFKDEKAQIFLDIAGRKAADRDAIIPLVGNRLVFSQSKNPYMRAMGQFMSWAMAKSAQLNSIVSKIEDGDGKLAVRMMAAVPLYMGIKELKSVVSPGERPESAENDDLINLMFDGLRIAGQASNVFIDKIFDTYKYNLKDQNPSGLAGGIAPGYGWLQDLLTALLSDAPKDIEVGDYEGALKEVLDEIPLASQAVKIFDGMIEDEPNINIKRSADVGYAKGGEVFVPNAPIEPDERIDKMTGLPYDVQAGIPFIDEEDPLKRLGLVGGGNVAYVDPLERMGFGLGGSLGKGISKIVSSFTKSSGDDATETFETVAAKELADATPDGSVDDVVESLIGKTVDDVEVRQGVVGKDAEIAGSMTEKDIAAWQEANKLPESKRQKQNPEVIQSLQKVLAGKKFIEEHNKLVDEVFPPVIYTKENAPEFPTLVEVKGAVGKKTLTGGRGIIGADVSVDEGLRVSSRLDIPAYDQRGVWAVTLHEPGKSGKAFAYGQSAILKNVEFTTNPKDALDIAMGQAKGTIARMEGDWVNHNPTETYTKALELLDSDEWVQVGMNPYRHSYFYDKATMKPLKSASEVIQVGPLVLVKKDKNLIYADADDFKVDLSPESIKGKKKLRDQEINIDSVSFMEGGKVLKALSRGRLAGV